MVTTPHGQRGWQVPGQDIDSADRRAGGGSLAFGLGVTSLAVPVTVPRDAAMDHDLADVRAVEIADTNAAVVRAIAVAFAPQGVGGSSQCNQLH
jgi:hypothetical protein